MITFSEDFKLYVLPWISLTICLYIAWWFYRHVVVALLDKIKVRNIIRKKQKEREHALQKLEHRYQIDTKMDEILSLPPDQLLVHLKKRKYTAIEVLEAYIAKALQSNKKYNNVTEFIPQAHIWAAQLDEMKEIKGPLHGLPISVKDNIAVEGLDCTLGFGKNLHKPEAESANIVKSLMDLGAVPFVKTNLPQMLLCWGCGNPIFGDTANPLNPFLSPGGSSGGESSLISSGGSLLGVGNDAGGSCRIPAHFCGISGFKPTTGRISPQGMRSVAQGVVGLSATPGILSNSAALISQVFKELTMPGVQAKYDLGTVVPIDWNEKTFTSVKPLRIGYFTSIPYFPAVGDTEGVVLQAKAALEAEGHTLLPFELPDTFQIAKLLTDLVFADDGWNGDNIWKDEPVTTCALFPYIMCRLPKPCRTMIASILDFKAVRYSPRFAAFFRGGADKSRDLWGCMVTRGKILEDISKQWHSLELDLLICPAFPFPAVPMWCTPVLTPACVYTMIWNLCNFPAGVVRFGYESGAKIDAYQTQDDFLLEKAKKHVKGSQGMPIGIQIVGLPFQEEIVLRLMKEVECLRGVNK